jgi:Domain of unknown function (DUF4389)/Protein of unknown function (DUF2510)
VEPRDYPIDVRFDYPPRSSRGWAALTITLIKFLALLPHGVVLFFLTIAQVVVAFVAQVAVALNGEYPPGMFAFVAGVLRWNTRVSAFVLSLNDSYPPFSLQPRVDYPVDLFIERPARSNRLYALFTVIVEILFIAGLVALIVFLVHWVGSGSLGDSGSSGDSGLSHFNFRPPSTGANGLLLRQIAALPHYIVLAILGIVTFVIWLVVQWVILFRGSYPRSMFDLVAGITRWQIRVSGYVLGLSDRYPPFSFEPSLTATTPPFVPSAWYPDPTGRHQHRFWDGAAWTPHVADWGQTAFDPIG